MDANRLRFWMLADDAQWYRHAPDPGSSAPLPAPQAITPNDVRYDTARRRLCSTSLRAPPAITEDAAAAGAALARVPGSIDAFGTWASWDATAKAVTAAGTLPTPVPIFAPSAGAVPTDVAVGYDGILYVAVSGGVTLIDLRDHWDPASTSQPTVTPWRLAADPTGGVWALATAKGGAAPPASGSTVWIARIQGVPLPRVLLGTRYAPGVFRPSPENPTPPTTALVTQFSAPGEQPVAIAASPGGQIALLTWLAGGDARVRLLGGTGTDRRTRVFGAPITLTGVTFPYSLAWVAEDTIAVLVTGLPKEALVYPIDPTLPAALPRGDLYPLTAHDGGPFLHGTTLPPCYGVSPGPAPPEPLYPISLPSFAPIGVAACYNPNNPVQVFDETFAPGGRWGPIDSGSTQTIWHRLYLEAAIPRRCGVRVWLAATNDLNPPAIGAATGWHEHRFGAVPLAKSADVPVGVWVSTPSELPFNPGLLGCAPEPHVEGLFTVLVQRPGLAVRSLRGRYLWVRVELWSDGRSAPEIAALRAYGSRFSYVDHYLPELYRETVFGDAADAPGPATRADFLERLLDNCEGVLTPIEDRIAGSYLLTDARTAPDDGLDWLASWIGLVLDPALPTDRRRAMIAAAPRIAAAHGTLNGLTLALDAATGGAVTDGRVLVVEDFRLRRTFATLLGVDLGDPNDPLLPGLTISGNSYVGDTLFLGEPAQRQLILSIFAPGLQTSTERDSVQRFFEQLAFRVTILVHQDVAPVDLGLVRRTATAEAPAHVSVAVVTAPQPFIVGVASLVGVDTYLSKPTPPQVVTIGTSRVGAGDLLERPPTLDPRTEGGASS
jgi:phage tail-like protein